MVPKALASWVCGHARAENEARHRDNSRHAVDIHFVASGKIRTMTNMTYRSHEIRPCGQSLACSLCRVLGQVELLGHFHQIRERVGLHFLHDLAPVRLYGDLADTELATDLFV